MVMFDLLHNGNGSKFSSIDLASDPVHGYPPLYIGYACAQFGSTVYFTGGLNYYKNYDVVDNDNDKQSPPYGDGDNNDGNSNGKNNVGRNYQSMVEVKQETWRLDLPSAQWHKCCSGEMDLDPDGTRFLVTGRTVAYSSAAFTPDGRLYTYGGQLFKQCSKSATSSGPGPNVRSRSSSLFVNDVHFLGITVAAADAAATAPAQ